MSATMATLNHGLALWMGAMARACWQGGLVLALAALMGHTGLRRAPRACCWLWRLAALRLLVALIWSQPVNLPLLPARVKMNTETRRHEDPAVFDRMGRMSRPSRRGRTSPIARPILLLQTGQSTLDLRKPISVPPGIGVPTIRLVLLLLWLVGVGSTAVGLLLEARARGRRRAACRPLTEAGLAAGCRELCERLGVRRAPGLLVTAGGGSPWLEGIAAPVVIFPRGLLAACSPRELRLMLAHELAHLKRRDLQWGWLAAAAHGLFFFHPLVWLAGREWRLAQEMACDEIAMALTRAAADEYGGALLKVAAQRHPGARLAPGAVGVMESYQTLRRRLLRMKAREQTAPGRWAGAGVALMTFGVLGLVPWQVTAQEPPLSRPASARLAAPAHDMSSRRRQTAPLPRLPRRQSPSRLVTARQAASAPAAARIRPLASLRPSAPEAAFGPLPSGTTSAGPRLAPAASSPSAKQSGPRLPGAAGHQPGAANASSRPFAEPQPGSTANRFFTQPHAEPQPGSTANRFFARPSAEPRLAPQRTATPAAPGAEHRVSRPSRGSIAAPAGSGLLLLAEAPLPAAAAEDSPPADARVRQLLRAEAAAGRVPASPRRGQSRADLPDGRRRPKPMLGRGQAGVPSGGLPVAAPSARQAAPDVPAGLSGASGRARPPRAGAEAPAAPLSVGRGLPAASATEMAPLSVGRGLPAASPAKVAPLNSRPGGAPAATAPEAPPRPIEVAPPAALGPAVTPLPSAALQWRVLPAPRLQHAQTPLPVWVRPEALPAGERARLEAQGGSLVAIQLDQRTGRIMQVLHGRLVRGPLPHVAPQLPAPPAPGPAATPAAP